jgi:hypothetical protein
MTGELIFFDLPPGRRSRRAKRAPVAISPFSPPETGPTPFGPAAAFACAAPQCDPDYGT